jgi:hypothetical protein
MALRVLILALLAGLALDGQIGGPYPGGYPPGGYPPGGYPPGRYPPGQYPGGGAGIPVPGRGKKEQNAKPVIYLSGKISQKDTAKSTITLEAEDSRKIELKLSNDTRINGETGKKVAVLNVGDEVSIEAHTDDKGYFFADSIDIDHPIDAKSAGTKSSETKSTSDARPSGGDPDDQRPVLRRAPAASDSKDADTKRADTKPAESKTAGAKTADSKPAATAKKDDEFETGEEHEILPPGGVTSATASSDPDRPILRRGAPPKRAASDDADSEKPVELASAKAEIHHDPSPSAGTEASLPVPVREAPQAHDVAAVDEFIEKARETAFEFDQKLPNFYCREQVTRYLSETKKADWRAMDLLSYDLVYEDGKEDYRNLKINGKAVKAGADKESGAWSTGEFGTMVKDIFLPASAAVFRLKGQDTINHRAAKMYVFAVDKDHSHWKIQGGTQWILPAYKGTMWIDKETFNVLRIEMQATNVPSAFPYDHTESAAEYDYVMIKEHKFLLPTHAEVLSCERGSFVCSRNAIDFRNYHAYNGESTITFADQ